MKVYAGSTRFGEVVVSDGNTRQLLDPRLDLRNHSPTGFGWGYGGSGPAQLALALIADATGDDDLALSVYQDFKREVVAMWEESWSITDEEIVGWLRKKESCKECNGLGLVFSRGTMSPCDRCDGNG